MGAKGNIFPPTFVFHLISPKESMNDIFLIIFTAFELQTRKTTVDMKRGSEMIDPIFVQLDALLCNMGEGRGYQFEHEITLS